MQYRLAAVPGEALLGFLYNWTYAADLLISSVERRERDLITDKAVFAFSN